MKTRDGYILTEAGKREHRAVWEKHFGEIPNGWVVHHVNSVKDDNRPSNLVAMPERCHIWLHQNQIKNKRKFGRNQCFELCWEYLRRFGELDIIRRKYKKLNLDYKISKEYARALKYWLELSAPEFCHIKPKPFKANKRHYKLKKTKKAKKLPKYYYM